MYEIAVEKNLNAIYYRLKKLIITICKYVLNNSV